MTHLDMIRKYAHYAVRPFTAKQIENELGIEYTTVSKHLRKLLTENFIKCIGNDSGLNVYIINKNKVEQKLITTEPTEAKYHREFLKKVKMNDDLYKKTDLLIDNQINVSLQRALQQSVKDYTKDASNKDLLELTNLLRQIKKSFKTTK